MNQTGTPKVTCQREGTSTARSTAPGALERQVPPAEEPAESSAKNRQCDRSHRSKEGNECATRASAEESESLERNINDSPT